MKTKKQKKNLPEKITEKTPINEIIKKYPETREILMVYGLNCVGCSFSNEDTLETGLKIHGLEHEIKMILKDLNKIAEKNN